MKHLLATMLLAGALFGGSAVQACAPLVATDPVTGETYRSGSAEWLRREQAEWRMRSETVLIAQVREGRMLAGNAIEFTLTPIVSVYGGALPESDLRFRWNPGNTCNAFTLNIGDRVIAYVGAGGRIIGVTVPEQLQDRPPEFGRHLREIMRGLIGPRFSIPQS